MGAAQHDVAGVFVEDARQDLGVAGDGEGFRFGQAGAVGEAGVGDSFVDEVVVGEQDQLDARRHAGAGVAVADQLLERVGEALRRCGPILGVLLSEQFVGLGNQRGPYPVADQGVEAGEELEHAAGLLTDGGAASAPLALPAFLEFRLAGALVHVFLQRAAEQIIGFGLGGAEQQVLIHRCVGGGVEDQLGRLRRDRPGGELLSHTRRPFQLRRDLHGLAGAGPRSLLVTPQDLLSGGVAFPPGDLTHQLSLESRQRRPRPSHETQTLSQHTQVHLLQRQR